MCAALVNPYFQKNLPLEQNLLDSFITESIQVMGNKYYYLPRKIQHEDLVLGEDVVSKFEFAIEIEMYHESSKGWTADTNIISKFGLQISNEIVLTMSKTSWDSEITSYTQLHTMKTDSLRPQEGDLIYEPVSKSLLEIKFVKDTNTDFFQLGRVYQYQLTCEFFIYDSSEINTGISAIDEFMSNNSLDILDHQIRTENDDAIVYEDCGYMVEDEGTVPVEPDDVKYGTDFKEESLNIGFNVKNPFGE